MSGPLIACHYRRPGNTRVDISQAVNVASAPFKKEPNRFFKFLDKRTLKLLEHPFFNCEVQDDRPPGRCSEYDIVAKITSLIRPSIEKSLVVEIGPGPGGLTKEIIACNPKTLVLIEKDPQFLSILNKIGEGHFKTNLRIAIADALDHNQLPDSYFENVTSTDRINIVGNLPFHVASSILMEIIRSMYSPPLTDSSKFVRLLHDTHDLNLLFMFQKEVAQRIVASHSSPHRCRLSSICQQYFNVELCLIVPGSSFLPEPKVDAGVVKFTRLNKTVSSFDQTERLIKLMFLHPKKKIKSFLKNIQNSAIDIDPNLRPGNLTNEQISLLIGQFKQDPL